MPWSTCSASPSRSAGATRPRSGYATLACWGRGPWSPGCARSRPTVLRECSSHSPRPATTGRAGRATRRGGVSRDRFPRRCGGRVGARGGGGGQAEHAHRVHPHRCRAVIERWAARQDAAVLQARDRWPGGRRESVCPVGPPRRRGRRACALSRRRAGHRTGQCNGAQPGHQRRAGTGARPHPGRPAVLPVPGLAVKLLYGRWPRSSPPASGRCRPSSGSSGTSFRHPEIELALRDVLGD